jgi:hypothetical protein
LATLDDAAIASLDILLGTDNGERHSVHKAAGMLGSGLIVFLDRGLVDLDVLGLNDGDNLEELVPAAIHPMSCYSLAA